MNNAQLKSDQKEFELWPYFRGLYARDFLYHLWKLMDNEGAAKLIFFGQDVGDEEAIRGDLTEFLRFFEPVIPGQRMIIAVEHKTQKEIMGFCWFDTIIADVKANFGVFYRQKFWGPDTRSASRAVLDYGFQTWNLQMIYAYTPWQAARQHGLAIGMRELCKLPDYVKIKGNAQDVYCLGISKEQFDGE